MSYRLEHGVGMARTGEILRPELAGLDQHSTGPCGLSALDIRHDVVSHHHEP